MYRGRLRLSAGVAVCLAVASLCACTSSVTHSTQYDREQSSGSSGRAQALEKESDRQTSQSIGTMRDPSTCERQSLGPADLSLAILSVAGRRTQDVEFIVDTTMQRVDRFHGTSAGSTTDFDRPLQLIGMGEDDTALAVPQALPQPEHSAPTSVGILKKGTFSPFSSTQLLADQLPKVVTPAPLAGTISHGYAVWTEQLVTGETASSAWKMAWRVMGASAENSASASELLSSWTLTGQEILPIGSGWVPPAVDGQYAYIAAILPRSSSDKTTEEQIVQVALDRPGNVVSRHQGRLPAVIGQDVAWIQDTTGNGSEAAQDTFTLHWARSTHSDIAIETGDYFKVQWLAGDERFLVFVLQDRCSARTWVGRFDREKGVFTGWIYSKSDGISLSLNDSVAVWGNGSGNIGSDMYRWNLRTDKVEYLGKNDGFSVPFSAGDGIAAVPSFNEGTSFPRVQWSFEQPIGY